MNITNAHYTASGSITATIDGQEMSIPADPANRHYAALIEAGVEIAPWVEPPVTKEHQQAARAAAYVAEADPLFFKYQRGETTEEEWLDKIEEIRARYPYPEETE